MAWDVEFTDEFFEWFDKLTQAEQDSVDVGVGLLAARGTALGYP